MRLFYYYLFLSINITYATEYMYPVASIDNGATIFYIHQHSSTHIELFSWDSSTDHTEPILWSLFNPAGLQLLPSGLGFSFIDNGRLRIKLLQKRSPKTIDFDDPIININGLHWIDDHVCYCSAQQGDHFALFQLHDNGVLDYLVHSDKNDCMYPCKINNTLFYIERFNTSKGVQHSIMQCDYVVNNSSCQLVINFDDKPIIFLHMVSEQEGFVVEHEKTIDTHCPITQFLYYRIIKKGDNWQKELLFSFHIPIHLLLPGDQRIHESLLPLLPRIVGERVYFVDCSQNNDNNLEPYYYHLTSKTINKIPIAQNNKGHYFVPFLCGNTLYCGGNVQDGHQKPFISILT